MNTKFDQLRDNFIPNDSCIGNSEVISFINQFYARFHGDPEHLRSLFRSGYCWHFAHMLCSTFMRGTVCWTAPFGHFVWCDIDGIPYDIEGVHTGDTAYYIPEQHLGMRLYDFLHIPGKDFNASKEQVMEIIESYVRLSDESESGLGFCRDLLGISTASYYGVSSQCGYVVCVADDSNEHVIPGAEYIERDDTLMKFNSDQDAAKQAECDGIPILHDISAIPDWTYVDSPGNRVLIERYLNRLQRSFHGSEVNPLTL